MLSGSLTEKLKQIILNRVGIKEISRDENQLKAIILSRLKKLRITNTDEYVHYLLSSSRESEKEWDELLNQLLIGETYFFRDSGQIALLRNVILPELIDCGKLSKTIKIWSAGCSTGEEPYSIAMLIDELLPDHAGWNINIIGTDICTSALDRARKAIYSPWSFRAVNPYYKNRYFYDTFQGYQLNSNIRSMVDFRYYNLIQPDSKSYYSLGLEFDLIICRNVFIYFDEKMIRHCVGNFYNSIAWEGYLLCGHAEISQSKAADFKTIFSPESAIYKKTTKSITSFSPAVTTPIPELPKLFPAAEEKMFFIPEAPVKGNILSSKEIPVSPKPDPEKVIKSLIEKGDYRTAIQEIEEYLSINKNDFKLKVLAANIYANIGQHLKAEQLCTELQLSHPFEVEPFYILAQIANDRGDTNQAMTLYKKILYLNPNYFAASIELAAIYINRGENVKSQKLLSAAIEDLKKLSPSDLAFPYNAIKIGELIMELEKNFTKA